ncbi:5-oxoprolinase subunit PxpA [Allomuricauda sp. NBRC 101325]|uniref:5-oxoprolinase subunit PxpA n=1 Tax=Allomuricauda sp. NBRC 101325 TaxID=1113758 RepID=UPI0024A247EC|nr:5-oxoprolinase subunit PxpA [Muricauda sp. NBRC 101325]GLU44639.1 LamB/YcsF family protein [Muricauda sp. NBRC 101325]
MNQFSIDINCDVGEGVGNEAELFPFISSCNIACGGHAGTKQTMLQAAQLAKARGIKVGAHPSYPDQANFGRELMDITDAELIESIQSQLSTFIEVLKELQIPLHHIKAHGALYNQTAKDEHLAKVYLKAIQDYKDMALLYVPYNSVVAKLAKENGFRVAYEGFADRNYNADLSLVSRKDENALIQNPKQVLKHILPMIKTGKVCTVTEEFVEISVQTLCIHGDTAAALEILTYISEELPRNQVHIEK